MSKPDFIVTVKHKDSKYGCRVGAVWKSQYGYSMKLDPGVALVGGPDIYINLNTPRDRDGQGGGGGDFTPRGGGPVYDDFKDDEIPFATCTADDSARLISKVRV